MVMSDAELRDVLAERLARVRGRIADAARRAGRDVSEITLVAVTKYTPLRIAEIAHSLGAIDLGESRPQDLWERAAAIPSARWHFIGHLQRNKIDKTVPYITRIHSVDSERLLVALDRVGTKRGTPVPVLLEVNCSREAAKGGFAPEHVPVLQSLVQPRAGVQIDGLMTMAAHHADPRECRPVFAELRELRDRLRTATGIPLPMLSMGMSNDFEIAIEEGATLVRVGSTLFEGLGDR